MKNRIVLGLFLLVMILIQFIYKRMSMKSEHTLKAYGLHGEAHMDAATAQCVREKKSTHG
jgi:hypothetical protein